MREVEFLYCDLETKSATDLRASGVYRYVEDSEFEILMAGWSVDGMGDVEVSMGEDLRLGRVHIPFLLNPLVPIVSHNANFERICLSATFGPEAFPAERFIDTAALAAEAGYPRKLAELAKALGADPKDSAGTRLINLFSKPKKDGTFWTPEEKPEQWAEFITYCAQDVRTLIDVHRRLPDWPTETEHRLWLLDQKINDRGLPVDLDLAEAAEAAAHANALAQGEEMIWLTGIENPNSRDQILKWLNSPDGGAVVMNDLQATTVSSMLTKVTNPATRRVLELRQELALAAPAKFTSARASTNADGRMRGSLMFFGAHTGRWSGRRTQPHNMPREQFKDADGEHDKAAELVAILDVLLGHGATTTELKKLVRSLFIGPLTVVDYAAIEARVLAWMAGEEWMLKAFRDGRDIYSETGERMGGIGRQRGKGATLGLGYQGAVVSLRKQGVQGTDAELKKLVWLWRDAAPNIVRFWAEVEEAFWSSGEVGPIKFEMRGNDRAIILPSGRALVYHNVRKSGGRLTYDDPKGFRNDTYGGSLTENITQAVARDILGHGLLALDELGYAIVGHVHDEAIIEGAHDVAKVADIMCDLPDWADGLPMAAAGFVCDRYLKG